jgi:hypothetical protein
VGFASGVILIKAALDFGVTAAYVVTGTWPMAAMFGSFVLVDLATYWVSK